MELVLALLIGTLAAASVWLMLSRNLVRFLFGLVLIGNVANLAIFTVGGLTVEAPPFVVDGVAASVGTVANPLPQALVLTAIVIGFGLVSFTLVLALRAWEALGTVDVDEMRLAEGTPPDAHVAPVADPVADPVANPVAGPDAHAAEIVR